MTSEIAQQKTNGKMYLILSFVILLSAISQVTKTKKQNQV